MEVKVWAKMCGWCRRQIRRDVREGHPELWEETTRTWDQANFNTWARGLEIRRVAEGAGLFFKDEDWMITHIWVHQTNRSVDYWQLERFDHY